MELGTNLVMGSQPLTDHSKNNCGYDCDLIQHSHQSLMLDSDSGGISVALTKNTTAREEKKLVQFTR